MKIAMLTNNYKPVVGGVPISVERLADGLRRLGHVVYIFAPESGTGTEETEEYVVRCPVYKKKLKEELSCPKLYSAEVENKFREVEFDVIHVHHPMLMGHMALYFSHKYHIPLAYTYHTRYEQYLHYFHAFEWMLDMSKRQRLIGPESVADAGEWAVTKYMKDFTNRCDLVFAPTEHMKAHLMENGTNVRIRVLATGLSDLSYEEEAKETEEIRKRYKQDRDFLLCTVARLEKEKNLEFLLRGIACLKKKMNASFRLLIIGDGKQKAELKELTAGLGLTEDVVFTGCVPNGDIRHYQYACDAFVFASKSETQGIVLLEAMAAGCPVAAVKASGVIDLVKDNWNGCVTREDTEEWADGIIKILSDSSHYKRLREGARQTAGYYRADAIALQAEEAYKSMLHEQAEQDKWHGRCEGKRMSGVAARLRHLFNAAG